MKDTRLSEVHRMLGRAMTALVAMAAALVAVFLLTASTASAQDTATVTIEVWDPGYPDLEHHVLVDGVELTVTHNAQATIGLPASGLYALEARSDDPTGFDHVYCVTDSNTLIADTFDFFRGPLEFSLPAGGATCRMDADRPNVIGELIVNTEAPDDPSALFNYRVDGFSFGGSFAHTDGGSSTIDIVHPETGPNVFVNLKSVSPGQEWLTEISCSTGGDFVVAEASGRNPDVQWDHQYFGTVTCTMTHSPPPPTSTLTIRVLDPENPDREHNFELNGEPFTVTSGADVPLVIPVGEALDVGPVLPTPLPFSFASCNTVVLSPTDLGPYRSFVGVMPAEAIRCTYLVEPTYTAQLSVYTIAPLDPGVSFEYVLTDSERRTFTHTAGDLQDFELRSDHLGYFEVRLGARLSVSHPVGWVTEVGCVDELGAEIVLESNPSAIAIFDWASGDEISCVVEHIRLGTAQLTLTNVGDLRINSRSLDPGASSTLEFVADDDIALALQSWGRETLASAPGAPAVVVTGTCVGDGGRLSFSSDQGSSRFGHAMLTGSLPAGATVECDIAATEYGIYPTVTCLGGNGRIDVNVLNTSQSPHQFSLTVGNLSPRVRTVAALDWWRNPITGRADGTYPATLQRGGEVIWERDLVVACDDDPTVTGAEVRVITPCRNGRNFIAWQFANPTSSARSYVIEVVDKSTGELAAPNRSTTAAAHGAAVRGASNLPNGHYTYTVRVGGAVHASGDVSLTCDRWLELQFFERIYIEDIPGFDPYGRPNAILYIRSDGEVIGMAPHFGVFRLGHDDAAAFDLDLIAEQTVYFGPLTIECEGAAAVAFDGRFLSGTVPQYSGTVCTVVAEPF